MAWAASGTGTVAGATSVAAGTGFTTGVVTAPLGDTVFLTVAFDNTAAGTPVINSITVPVGETAAWVRQGLTNSPSGTSGTGLRTELWAIKTTQAWAAFAPVVTLSASITAKASCGFVMTGGFLNQRVVAPVTGGTSLVSVPSNANTSVLSGDLVVGSAGFETATLATGDADTTNGSWSAAIRSATATGADNLNISAITQWKIATANGTQTYNPTNTTSTDSGAVAVGFSSVVTSEQISRVHVETLVKPAATEQVSRVHAEVLAKPVPNAQISRVHLEVLYNPAAAGTGQAAQWTWV